jgi:hypothetical protein|nr:MAG TPA: hypothetical protein [Caudoviricetes sp.]
MKQKLEELTIGQFVDLICGDVGVLLGRHEIASPQRQAAAIRDIVFEYRELSDRAGAQSYLSNIEELIRNKVRMSIFSECLELVRIRKYETARNIMEQLGIGVTKMNDERLTAEIKSQLARAKQAEARAKENSHDPDSDAAEIRRSFDEQTAALIAFFKFQIDTETMKATIYALLVARYNREIKAQLAAMNKK